MIKKKRNCKLKAVNPQANENKALKPKFLENVGDLLNEKYYIYKEKKNEKKKRIKKKKKKNFFTTKILDLLMIIDTSLKKKKKKKNNRLVKRLMKKNHLKFQQKIMRVILTNGLMNKKEA